VDPISPPALVGRARECEAMAGALETLRVRPGGTITVEGEPGIGKSLLLAELAARAGAGGCTVLWGRASEFEADLPYALWTDALEGHLAESRDRGSSRLGVPDPGALGVVVPALADADGEPAPRDRHRTHRALRDLLERLAAVRPLVLCMDDVHWADPASVDALAALVRRPPTAAVLLAVALREGQAPAALATALAYAMREDRVTRLAPGPLNEAEAAELVGPAAAAIYPLSGGNPFYLEQLARVPRGARVGAGIAADVPVPRAVADALSTELTGLTPDARRMLDAAAIAGDPFEPGLAAEVAELAEAAALRALDELLARTLVRPAGVPRRFAFRHPVIRHAVYTTAPGGWRLGAHARAAVALERRGAGPVERAHHTEHAAVPGDQEALALLTAAAGELQSPAPAAAARLYAAALRLLADRPEHIERRTAIQARLAEAQSAAGDPGAARQTLLGALGTAGSDARLALTVAVANMELWIGRHEDARRRLHVALAELPAQPSEDRIRLRLALAMTALVACDLSEARAHASDAREDARAIGEPVFRLAALSAGVVARVMQGEGRDAISDLDESAAALERLSAAQLATRLPAFWMHGCARHALGRFEEALADFERGAAIAGDTGRESVLLLLTVASVAPLVELGRLGEAAAAGQEGIERAQLLGNPAMLVWAHSALARARLTAGDVTAALRHAAEAAELTSSPGFYAAGQPGWCLGAARTAAGNPEAAVPLMLDALGGAQLTRILPADRPAAAADLVEAQLARGDLAAAEEALAAGEAASARAGTAWSAALTGIARAAVALARPDRDRAVAAAAAAREAATDAPLASALARLAEGRALAAAGRRRAAIEALAAAESALHRFGAVRRRDEAARELRRLGRRVVRPAPASALGPHAPLSAREREIAELVAAGRTNREIAEQLVLSTRTIEAHLRNVYGKLGVRSRVELTRQAQRMPDPRRSDQ
jgi:ATP/maltotriose-dependent transcriptional regulator MalT